MVGSTDTLANYALYWRPGIIDGFEPYDARDECAPANARLRISMPHDGVLDVYSYETKTTLVVPVRDIDLLIAVLGDRQQMTGLVALDCAPEHWR